MIHSVRTGAPAVEKVYGAPIFEHFARERGLSATFNEAMTTFSATVVPAVLEVYDFSGIDTLVDVGGGHGHVLTSILQRYPAMKGVLFDVEHVLEGGTARVREQGLEQRCQTVAGAFFQQVPRGGDAYIMKHIIHDWNDARALVILRHIRAALEGVPRGRLLIIDAIVAPANQPDLNKLIDLEMLALPGGRERTEADFRALLRTAGFELTRVLPTPSPLCVIEAEAR